MPVEINHPDYWTEALQFTPTVHRDVYASLSPSNERIRRIAKDKVVLITGAGSGFGKGACFQWARAGAHAIVLAGRGQPRIDEIACSVRAETQSVHLLAIAADVSSESQVDRLFREATAAFGRVDVLVHCAGVLGPIINLGESVVEGWWNAFEINAKGAFLLGRRMAQLSSSREVTLINTGTAASYFANPGQSSYTASKAVANMLLDQLHAECKNLRVFNVHPGMAKSSILRPELEVYARDTPELFGGLTIYLAGAQAEFLRGRFVVANWDVDELERYRDQIVAQGLLKNQLFKGNLGPGGHPL